MPDVHTGAKDGDRAGRAASTTPAESFFPLVHDVLSRHTFDGQGRRLLPVRHCRLELLGQIWPMFLLLNGLG